MGESGHLHARLMLLRRQYRQNASSIQRNSTTSV